MTGHSTEFRKRVLATAAAVFGISLGIALLPAWLRSAPAGQLPGFMTAVGLDARASYRFFAGLVALALLTPALGMPVVTRLCEGGRWAFVAATAALSSSLWIALAKERVAWVAIPPLLTVAICHRLRLVRQRFTRSDAILLPTALCVFVALTDIAPNAAFPRRIVVSAFLVILVRLSLPYLRWARSLRPSWCFLLSPLGLVLQSHYNGYHQRHFGWAPLSIALLTPFLFPFLIRNRSHARRWLQVATTAVIYPITILAYASTTSTLAAEGKPHADLFEDAHNLAVASEMLRGERPYRDIIPTHGLIQDGLLDFLILRTRKPTAGHVIETHGVIGGTIAIAGYAVTTCAVGSADVGLLGYFLASSMGTAGGGLRAMPALFGLALLVYGLRKRTSRPFFYASGLVVVAGLTSLDFGAYTAIALLIAVLRLGAGPPRKRAARAAAMGFLVAGTITALALLATGILVDFVRTTLFDVASVASAYALTPFNTSDVLSKHRFPPELLVGLFDRSSFAPLFWAIALLGLAVGITIRRPHRSPLHRWNDALLALASWVVVAGLSYAERQHAYFMFLAAPMGASVIAILSIHRTAVHRYSAGLITVILLMLAQPTAYLSVIDMLRHTHGPLDQTVVEVDDVPRARGALYRPADATTIRSARKYVSSSLGAGDTFFDFTNRGALYFLLDRDCPVRQVEVAFYERDKQQREVIRRIEENPRVRAALIPRDGDLSTMVDAVPNQQRAPLVWEYLRRHFQPDFEEGDVIFWKRITPER